MVTNMKGFAKSFIPGLETSEMEDEGAVSIFLGGLIGTAFGASGTARENRQLRKVMTEEQDRKSKLFGPDGVGAVAANLFVDDVKSVYKKDGTTTVKVGEKEIEIPKFVTETLANGQTRLAKDPEALLNKTINELHNSQH